MTGRILTHRAPDLDAIVSAWLAQQYLFEAEPEVVFVPRTIDPARYPNDCLVDIGNTYDPPLLRFDHKPPAFPDRNQTCAAKLVWEHILALGKPVAHLAPLVQVTYEGDTRRFSPALKQSRLDGPHAGLSRVVRLYPCDEDRYAHMRCWLSEYSRARPGSTARLWMSYNAIGGCGWQSDRTARRGDW
jgi:hypothetical protein